MNEATLKHRINSPFFLRGGRGIINSPQIIPL
jgi:hypothetical protein